MGWAENWAGLHDNVRVQRAYLRIVGRWVCVQGAKVLPPTNYPRGPPTIYQQTTYRMVGARRPALASGINLSVHFPS